MRDKVPYLTSLAPAEGYIEKRGDMPGPVFRSRFIAEDANDPDLTSMF
jgi:hypothetical protein